MNAKYLRIIAIFGLAFAVFGSASKVAADPPPDVLENYTISVLPQQDGTLAMSYALDNYCAMSDWPGDLPYLQIGVPNSDFTITDWGPKDGAIKVVQAEVVNRNGSFVQLDFDRGTLPKNGDCFNLNFSIIQNKMAYVDPANENVTFKFIPAGWNFPIRVTTITLNWALPEDPALILVTDPSPTGKDSANMVWQWNNPGMNSAGMFSDSAVSLAYDKSAFTLPVVSAAPQPADGGSGISGLTIIIILVGVVVLLFVLAWIGGVFDDSGSSLGSDYYGGSSYTPSSYTPSSSGSSRSSGGGSSRRSSGGGGGYTPRSSGGGGFGSSGGGYGGSSGRSSSCVSAPSCACACACAGGGRVGCSRKGIGIQCLDKVINDMTAGSDTDQKGE